MTLIINFFGGPSCGKSTYAAGVFCELKKKQINTELVTEFAKDLVWEKRNSALRCQPYVFGKQLHRIEKLIDQTEVVITDSPLLLSVIYNSKYPKSFTDSVVEIFNSFRNKNFLIKREKDKFESVGRNEDLQQAEKIDNQIINLLSKNNIEFEILEGESLCAKEICKKISTYIECGP